MEQSYILFNQVLIMFILVLVGFFCSKTGLISKRANKQLSNLVLTIISAALILDSYQQDFDPEISFNLLLIFILSLLVLFIGFFISQFLKIGSTPKSLGTEKYAAIFPNSGYMGIPLLIALMGPKGALYGSTFLVAFQIVSWTLGVGLLVKPFNKKLVLTALTSPVLICVAIGMPMFFLGIKFPSPLASAISSTASMLTPMAMFVCGGFIAQTNILTAFKTKRNYLVSFLRMILIPFIMMLILYILPISPEVKTTVLILASAPCATGTIQFCSRFGGDVTRASGMVTISTIFCILTIPLMIIISEFLW